MFLQKEIPTMDETSLPQRILRHAQLSKTGLGLAARLIGQHYLGLDIDKAKHALNYVWH
jgi:hypothetical protein